MGSLNACLAKLADGALDAGEIADLKQIRAENVKSGMTESEADRAAVLAALRDAKQEEQSIHDELDAQDNGKVEAVQAVVDQVTDGWASASDVVVLANPEALPADAKKAVNSEFDGKEEGLYLDGTVYLFADNLAPGRVAWVLAHELVGHKGTMAVFKSNGDFHAAVRDSLDTRHGAALVDALARDRGLDLTNAADNKIAHAEAIAELAAASETNDWQALADRYGLTPDAREAYATSWKDSLARFLTAVKQAVKDLFSGKVPDFSDAKANALARSLLKEGRKAAETGTSRSAPGALRSTSERRFNADGERVTTDEEVRSFLLSAGSLPDGLTALSGVGRGIPARSLAKIRRIASAYIAGGREANAGSGGPVAATLHRRAESSLGPFSGYSTRARIHNGSLIIDVWGDEQIDAGLTEEPALRMFVLPDGYFYVNGPRQGRNTFAAFEERGWAEAAKGKDGQPVQGWTALRDPTTKNGELRQSEITELLADAYARVRLWKNADRVGMFWDRVTGATGMGDIEKGRQAAVFFSKAPDAALAEGRENRETVNTRDVPVFKKVTSRLAPRARKQALKVIPTSFLNTLADPVIKPFADTFERTRSTIEGQRQKLSQTFGGVADLWSKLLRKDKAAAYRLADLMHDSTIYGVDVSETYSELYTEADYQAEYKAILAEARAKKGMSQERTKRLEDAQKKRAHELKRAKAHKAFEPRWKALPEDAQKVYTRTRDAYRGVIENYEKAVLANIANALDNVRAAAKIENERELRDLDAMEGLTREERDSRRKKALDKFIESNTNTKNTLEALQAQMRERFESQRVAGIYFPLSRFGEYWAYAKNDKGETVDFRKFDNPAEQEAFVEQAKKEGYPIVKSGMDANPVGLDDAVDPGFAAKVTQVVDNYKGITQEGKDELTRQMYQVFLDTLPEASIRKQFKTRKKTAGYSNDAFKAFAGNLLHASLQTARLSHGQKLRKAIMEMEGAKERAEDPNAAAQLIAEYRQRHDNLLNPRGSAVANWLTSAAFVYHLTSPASAAVNSTALGMTVYPDLAAEFGPAQASKHLVSAMKDSTAAMFSLRKFHKDQPAYPGMSTEEIDAAERKRFKETVTSKLSPDEADFLYDMYAAGAIDRTQTNDLVSMSNLGSGYSAASHRAHQLNSMAGYLFHTVERFNREATALAYYRAAKTKAFGKVPEKVTDNAVDFLKRTHFDYSNSNRNQVMQNDLGRVLLIFRNYHFNMLARVLTDARTALKGVDKDTKRLAARRLGFTMANHMLFAGALGVPFVGTLLWALGKLGFDDDDKTFNEQFQQGVIEFARNNLGDEEWGRFLLNGAVDATAGVQVGNRIGFGNIWARDRTEEEKEGTDEYQQLLSDSVGALGPVVENFFKAKQLASEGQTSRAWEVVMPALFKNALKGVRFAQEGARNKDGGEVVGEDELDAFDVVGQAAGFTPNEVADAYAEGALIRASKSRLGTERSNLIASIVNADGDEELADAWADAKAFNAEYVPKYGPELKITPKAVRDKKRSQARRNKRVEDGVYLPKGQSEYREEATLYTGEDDDEEP